MPRNKRFRENRICKYELILFSIENKNDIPNFSYEITGNSQLIRDDIEYYKINKKRLPRKAVKEYRLKHTFFARKLSFIFSICLLSLILLLMAICLYKN